MKTVYTVTFQRVLNYGAVLQAYALLRYLNEQGVDAKVIDYAPSYFLLQTYRPAKGIKKTIDKYKKFRKFKAFRQKHMKLTPKTYYSFDSLKNLPKADAVVCGSDQIWNYNLTGKDFDPTFFLNFAPANTKRIAFAASAGSIRIKDFGSKVKSYLESFHTIGTREENLAQDVKEVAPNTTPVVVVDPCLLIKDYTPVFDDKLIPKQEYVVSYVVGSGEMLTRFNQRIAQFKQNNSIQIIHLGAKPIRAADQNVLDIGPSDWVTFIKHAKYVITNSFHGTAFSINFEKNFVFVPHVLENLNARQTTLLNNVGLIDRMLSDEDELHHISDINYNEVTPKLDALVHNSQQFLLDSLK